MKHLKHVLLIVLVCALALPLFCACGENEESSSAVSDTSNTASDTSTGESSTDIAPDVIDLDGDEINILCWDWTAGSNSIKGWTGEVLYKDLNEDNASSIDLKKKEVVDYIETTYNCTIGGEVKQTTSFVNDVEAMVTANTYDYDMVFCNSRTAASMLNKNLLTNLYDISTINLSNSWWDQNAVSDMSIDGKLFWVCGDINTYDNLGTWCVLFNKTLKSDLGITDNFYQIAKDGDWTLDYFMQVCKGLTQDLNGDGIDEFDQWALGTETYNIYAQVVGGGLRITDKGDDDLPYLTVTGAKEQTYNALTAITDFYLSQDVMVANGGDYDNKGYSNVWEATVHKAFIEGRELFYMCGLINVAGFREMDDDIGILPIPKTFATQDQYYHTVSVDNSSYLCIPYGVPDAEELGVVIEAIAMKSKEIVTPEFYDNQLKYRDARDDDSAEMLDLIFASRSFDLGPIFSWGNIFSCYTAMNTNVESRFDSALSAAEIAIADTVELVQSYVPAE